MHWLVISRCIFILIVVLFCACESVVSHLARFPPSRPRLAKVTPIKMRNMLYNI
nr:MAG TPA: hypothetical protein [Microviridae sp.]